MPARRIDHTADADCPPPMELADRRGWIATPRAMYTAKRDGKWIIVRAEGEHPTAGWKIVFAKDGERLALLAHPPEGIAAQVMTRFSICARVPAPARTNAVAIVDESGETTVKVR